MIQDKYIQGNSLTELNIKLDRGSIRSSPRYGLSTPYGLTKEQYWTVPPCSYLQGRPAFGPELVHPGCWILIMVQQVRLMMF